MYSYQGPLRVRYVYIMSLSRLGTELMLTMSRHRILQVLWHTVGGPRLASSPCASHSGDDDVDRILYKAHDGYFCCAVCGEMAFESR